jgi:hypothetical protein
MTWKSFVVTALATLLASASLLYVFILLADPYDDVWFSPPFEREPLSKNQRFSYPGLARNPHFDSVIVGTSSSRLLRPDRIGPPLGASFVNLAMNAATPYEQSEILSVFRRAHRRVKYAVFGVDEIWCDPDKLRDRFDLYSFPEWMYDEDPWNDLPHLFNEEALSQAWSQFRNAMGWRRPRWGMDGYRNFLPPESRYDPDRVRRKLYKDDGPDATVLSAAAREEVAKESAHWPFPNLDLLRRMLASLPSDTVKVVFLPPYNHTHLPAHGSRQDTVLQACKVRIVDIARAIKGTTVVDFMFRSPITLADDNYWDRVHYRVSVADKIDRSLLVALGKGPEDTKSAVYRILWPTDQGGPPGLGTASR